MKKEINFALYAIKKNLAGSAELRTSFLMNIFGMTINNISFVIIWVFLVQTAGDIGGWTSADVFGLQGFVALVYGFVFSFGAGLKDIPRLVSSGIFDQFLLSPKSLLVRTATSSFSASAIGDVFFGIICLIVYLVMISAGIPQILLTLLLTIFSVFAFIGVTISIQSISFYFTDPDSVTRSIFELFFSPSLFHGGAFQGPTRFFFTFIIPSLVIGTLPVEAVSHLSYGKVALVGIISIFWLFFSFWLFKRAVKKYESSNFMTFGA
ncbi:MAG: ABC-2 family transporter protein [Minisyncoccia bacterium]